MDTLPAALLPLHTTHSLWVLGVTFVVLLLVLFVISLAENSLFALAPGDVRNLTPRSGRASAVILRLLGHVERLQATLLVATLLLNIALTILFVALLDCWLGWYGSWLVVKILAVALLLLGVGSVLPKWVVQHASPQRIALLVARPMGWISTLFYPLAYLVIRRGQHLLENSSPIPESALEELSDAVDLAQTTSQEEREMISGVVNLEDTEVQEIMKPRVDIFALEIATPYEQVKRDLIETGFSRIPVYEGDIDHIRGTLYVKDLLPYLHQESEFDWHTLLRKPYFIPENKKINELLTEFRSKKQHLAIVVDEYGSTQGLVSLEDILEEIVGEIADESDTEEYPYTQVGERSYLFEGKTLLGDFERLMGLEEDTFADVRGEADTLAGLLLEFKHDFPQEGDCFQLHAIRFTVQEMSSHRIDTIRVDLL